MINSISIESRARNFGLRVIVFKEKKLAKILKGFSNEIKTISKIYYTKLQICTAEGINIYNELSEEDKIIFDTISSLFY